MSTYYAIHAKIKISELSKVEGIEVKKGENKNDYSIIDKYDNCLRALVDDEGELYQVIRYFGEDPLFILHSIVKNFDAQVISEEDYVGFIHDASAEDADLVEINKKEKQMVIAYTDWLINFFEENDVDEYYEKLKKEFKEKYGEPDENGWYDLPF